MRLASGTVLGLAAVVTSPALYQGLVTRQLPVDVALTRFLVAVVVVWLALSAVGMLVGEPAGKPAGDQTSGPERHPDIERDGTVEQPSS